MRKRYKIAGAIVGLIVIGAAGAVAFAQFGSERKLNRTVRVDVKPIAIATDAAGIERGKYLYESRGCTECHGRDGAGRVVIDDHAGFFVRAPDISTTPGGVATTLSDTDWVGVVRHGLKPDGHPLMVMPSEDYARMTDEDTGMMIGYLKTLPPAHGGPAEMKLPLLVRFLYAAGIVRDAAEKIDHTLLPPQIVASTETIAYGDYVANSCRGCHNEALSGGKIPGTPPDWPPSGNLTPGPDNALAHYADVAAFSAMLKTGKRPDGSEVSRIMPFDSLKEMDDKDVQAVFAFLKTLPPKKQGEL
jgi:mono/diheme cytochrome c family protein